MMRPILLLLVCVVSMHAQQLRHAEMLGRPTDRSITVQLFFDEAAEVQVGVGTTRGDYARITSWQRFEAGQPAEIVLDGLEPNTQYYYSVFTRRPGDVDITIRPDYAFHTQRTPGSTFSFVVQADPHMDEQTDTAIYRRCLLNQLEDAPDFMIDLGDFLMSDKLKNASGKITHDTVTARCHLLRSYYETSAHSVPLFIALGNHEGEAGWQRGATAENLAVWGTNDRKTYFLNPSPDAFYTGDTTQHPYVGLRENYYAWQWGDAQFIVLDPYWYTAPKPDSLHGWRWTLGATQYEWLRKTLESSTSKFTFVFAHQLIGGDPDGRGGVEFADLYEWGGKDLDGTNSFAKNRPGWYKPIKDLLTEHRVNIFFHGHDHFFGKQEKDCLIYQETPQPSHPNFSNAGQADDYGYISGQILPNSGHLRVTVAPEGVRVEYVRAYKAANETATRHNKDVSATYFIGTTNCYDSITTSVPVLWNSNYADELVYPNPTERAITISFNVTTANTTTLAIFDAAGNLVRTVLNEQPVAPGAYHVVWDGTDARGLPVSAGTYYYRVEGKGGMVVVK